MVRVRLSRYGESINLEEEVVEQLFTLHAIYGENKSSTIAEARVARWKTIKNKSFNRLPPYANSLRQQCHRTNYLAYLMPHPSLKRHPSPLGCGRELVGGRCRVIRHTRPALPTDLPALGPAKESGKDDSENEGDDDVQRKGIHLNLMIQNLVRQNALIRTDHISQCHIDSSAAMS